MRSPGSSTMNWLRYQTRWSTPKTMSAVVPSWRRTPLTDSAAEGLRVGDLVGGHQLRTERVERLAALALVPLAAALELELPLGHVVRDHVAGDVARGVAGRVEVARRRPIDHAELDLPVGLRGPRGISTSSKGPTTVSGPS